MNYHDETDSISKTMLSHFHASPCEFNRYYVAKLQRPPQPKAAIVGSIAHAVLLEGKQLGDIACLYPSDCLKSNGAINPKPARQWEQSLDHDQYAVKSDVYSQCDALLAGIASHPVVGLVADAHAREERVDCLDEQSGLRCRCRPDFLYDMGDEIICYDLKFTTQVKPREFWRVARMFRYWMQDAHYSRTIEAATGKPCKFVFWAIEDTPPYRVARYEYTADSRENARAEVAATLRDLASRYETGDWSDSWTSGTNDLLFTSTESTSLELDWSGIE